MTMDQSHYLNIFEQYSLMNHMLIYHTKYQRYLSNSNTQDPPSYKHFKDLKEPIRLLLKYEPLNGIEDELYLETIMEDTFHFALFNALTKLFMKVLEDTVAFMEKTNNLPTLAVLFVIEQIENQLPLISKKWESYFGEIIGEFEKYSKNSLIKKAVNEAKDNEEVLNFANDKLLDLLRKYDSVFEDEDNIDLENKKTQTTEQKITLEVFKHIVKLYYQTKDGETAYQK